jgi:hypothetical protein
LVTLVGSEHKPLLDGAINAPEEPGNRVQIPTNSACFASIQRYNATFIVITACWATRVRVGQGTLRLIQSYTERFAILVTPLWKRLIQGYGRKERVGVLERIDLTNPEHRDSILPAGLKAWDRIAWY